VTIRMKKSGLSGLFHFSKHNFLLRSYFGLYISQGYLSFLYARKPQMYTAAHLYLAYQAMIL
jgi:hypothetical protein